MLESIPLAPRPLNVLIACEESGEVRRAFRNLGHNAWSCDLVPARDGSIYHIQGDVRAVLRGEEVIPGDTFPVAYWDLLIGFPTCTYLCNSGVRWFTTPPKDPAILTGEARIAALREGVELFADLYHARIPMIAIENPVMHGRARNLLRVEHGVPRFTQTVQPWQFGVEQFKRTCFWLKGLPMLRPTTPEARPPRPGTREHKEWSQVHRESPGPLRAQIRSTTFQGIAEAMAEQWGGDARRFLPEGDQL